PRPGDARCPRGPLAPVPHDRQARGSDPPTLRSRARRDAEPRGAGSPGAMMEVAMFLGGHSAVSRTESVGSPSGRARRGQGADAAERDDATFAAALMSARMRTGRAPGVLRIEASLERQDP